MIYLGLLPLATALFGVLRAHERPRPGFWIFAAIGAGLVISYALVRSTGGASLLGDGLMLAAIVVCGLGYAEGGRLSRHLGGWQVISWALVVALPAMPPLALSEAPSAWAGVGWPALAGLAYVLLFSMLIGFVFWYRGLALAGIAAVGQLQLVQPFLGLIWAALLLGERIDPALVLVCAAVLLCVAGAQRFAR